MDEIDIMYEMDKLREEVGHLKQIAKHHGALCNRCDTVLILSKYNDPNNPYDADSFEDHLGGLCSSCWSDDQGNNNGR